jgi:hypothetical protein
MLILFLSVLNVSATGHYGGKLAYGPWSLSNGKIP